ncbi:MAG TPA: twin transmembrane helix small protein [Roseiflexaceae bacterium]|nr:twin transmembrane helix small protein [Roseiflexaceae bacterium]
MLRISYWWRMLEGKILVGIATVAVALVLVVGLYSLYRGGDFSRTWSNKIMRLRIVAQFVAIVVIMSVLYFWGRGPSGP